LGFVSWFVVLVAVVFGVFVDVFFVFVSGGFCVDAFVFWDVYEDFFECGYGFAPLYMLFLAYTCLWFVS